MVKKTSLAYTRTTNPIYMKLLSVETDVFFKGENIISIINLLFKFRIILIKKKVINFSI